MAIPNLKQLTVADAKEGDIVVVEAKVVRTETGNRTYVQFQGISEVTFFDSKIPVKEIKYDFKIGNKVRSATSPSKIGEILFIIKEEDKALVQWEGYIQGSQRHSVIQLKNITPYVEQRPLKDYGSQYINQKGSYNVS